MKKYLNYSLAYAVAAMVFGVFYREYTKWSGFTGVTVLGKIHGHLFALGMIMFLIVALFAYHKPLCEIKAFKTFMLTYNTGLPIMVLMILARGVTQVGDIALSRGMSAAISGVAGIGHILVAVGIIALITALKKAYLEN